LSGDLQDVEREVRGRIARTERGTELSAASKSGPGQVPAETKFEPVPGWGLLPHGMTFRGDATSVAVDSEDNVYVFNRGPVPMVVFDRDGNYLTGWGEGDFTRPHGATFDADNNVYLVDDDGHFVQKRTRDGSVLLTIGERGKGSPKESGEPFNRPTGIAVHPRTGELFISDGYGNSRVHRYDPNGQYMESWGSSGSMPGMFSLPHSICMLGEDRLVVSDRENFRLQVFSTDGEFIEQWHIHHPMTTLQGRGDDDSLYVGEMGPPPVQAGVPNLGNNVAVLSSAGEFVTRFGGSLPGPGPDQFTAPHGIAIDSQGSVYVAEVAWTFWYSRQPNPPLGEVPSLRKWRRVSG